MRLMNIRYLKLISFFVFLSAILAGCSDIINKIKNIAYSIDEVAIYKEMGVDPFYWDTGDRDIDRIPLIKPYTLVRPKGNDNVWKLALPDELYSNWKDEYVDYRTRTFYDNNTRTSPISYIYVKNIYIYGFKDVLESKELNIPSFYFIIDTEKNQIKTYDTDRQEVFLTDLKSLDITLDIEENWAVPDTLFDDFRFDPILPWFPQEIKNQLEEVKKKVKK